MGWPLPPELTGRIVSYLANPVTSRNSKPELAQYATVNREWQTLVEEQSWATLRVKTGTPLDLTEFEKATGHPRRRSYIRNIELIVGLEPYDEAARAHFETEAEHDRNNQIFSKAIQSMLQILAKWPANHPGISLSIQAQSPSDLVACPNRLRRKKAARADRTTDLLNRRFERNYHRLDDQFESQVEPLKLVHTLTVEGLSDRRQIDAVSCARLASRFPRLHTLNLSLNDTCKRDKALRKSNRNGIYNILIYWFQKDLLIMSVEFAAHLDLLPPTVKTFNLHFNNELPEDHNFPPDDITENNIDPLSSGLREFSQQLVTLDLYETTIGTDLFWPLETSKDQLPSWPNLSTINIRYTPVTPSGKWLFKDRPDRDENDHFESADSDPDGDFPEYVRTPLEDRSGKPFREVGVSDLFNDLYMAVGQAALQMPQLVFLNMETQSGQGHSWFRYTSKGEVKATWSDFYGFQPKDEVLDLWKKVAFEHTGEDLIVELCNN